jgi:hypothetical protein
MKKLLSFLFVILVCVSLLSSGFFYFKPTYVMATNQVNNSTVSNSGKNGDNTNPYLVKTFIDNKGNQIDEVKTPLKPPATKELAVKPPATDLAAGINVLTNVPAFYWSYGCSATSAAMLFGYYDNNGYPNMYTGSTNSGVCPMTNEVWGTTTYPSVTCGECPLSATHEGIDGLATKGHVNDYWIDYGSTAPDPYITGGWTEHQSNCAGDFMGTNQSKYGNTDGSTTFYFNTNGTPLYNYTGSEPGSRDGCHGLRLFAESRGYTVITNYSQYIQGYHNIRNNGFTFNDFVNEINAGRPVLIQLNGHTVLGYGYNTTGQIVYIHDTWDYSDHQMTWGGKYAGLQQYGVTVIELAPTTTSTLSITTASLSDGMIGVSYSQTLQAAGGTGSYTWSISSGSLPTGLSLNVSTGVISGTPTTANTYNFTVQVTDGNQTATKSLSITINSATLTITTSSLPNGIVGVFYSQTLQATDGAGSYTWSISSGSLPLGLSLNASTGIISGTPTTASKYNFIVEVASIDQTATKSFTIMIKSRGKH